MASVSDAGDEEIFAEEGLHAAMKSDNKQITKAGKKSLWEEDRFVFIQA